MPTPLPPEIIDLIFDFLPLCDYLSPELPSETLLACTEVSRSFSAASRRRIFSSLFLAQASDTDKTRAKLEALAELIEKNPHVLRATHTIEITISYGACRRWAFLNDKLLHRILRVVVLRRRNINLLKIDCHRSPYFDFARGFGERTKQVIKDLIPWVRSLSLNYLNLPTTLLEHLPPLKLLDLRNVKLLSQTSGFQIPSQSFSNHTRISIDTKSLEDIHRICRQILQPLPSFTNLQLDIHFEGPSFGIIQLDEKLDSSLQTLQCLTIQATSSFDLNSHQVEFSRFKRLSTFKIAYSSYLDFKPFVGASGLETSLVSVAKFLDSASLPSNIINVEIEISGLGPIYHFQDEMVSSLCPIEGLNSEKLFAKHPKLQSILIDIVPPTAGTHLARITSAPTTLIQRSLETCLPNALGVFADSTLMTYTIPLNSL
ncbi:hypothetical protein CPB83DRAFT_899787 [Crepidotus variabilis]|uniref:F-box domain-containing protein n=1 Tax=Crepidotus variabilis TaxID=179855 RepID=A0A9P6JIU1_9AGAR|nr:hypothetical protein CPB83DRAFT_899787 [Crepidotus variabilis]